MHQDSLYLHIYPGGYIALTEKNNKKNCPFFIDAFFKYLTLSLSIYMGIFLDSVLIQ